MSFSTNDIPPTILNALFYISAHYHENPRVDIIAKQIGLSPTYFSKLFKHVMNKSYSEYIILIRLQKSRILLMQTTLSIHEIAEKVGHI